MHNARSRGTSISKMLNIPSAGNNTSALFNPSHATFSTCLSLHSEAYTGSLVYITHATPELAPNLPSPLQNWPHGATEEQDKGQQAQGTKGRRGEENKTDLIIVLDLLLLCIGQLVGNLLEFGFAHGFCCCSFK